MVANVRRFEPLWLVPRYKLHPSSLFYKKTQVVTADEVMVWNALEILMELFSIPKPER